MKLNDDDSLKLTNEEISLYLKLDSEEEYDLIRETIYNLAILNFIKNEE